MKTYLLNIVLFSSLLFFYSCEKDPVAKSTKHLAIEVWEKNLENPWGMAFLPNGDFLFCERVGNINLRKKNSTDYNLIMFRNVLGSEGGLLGLAIDPAFTTNHYVYIYETVTTGNQVVRLILDNNDQITQDAVLLDSIPKANNHDGGAIRFGPDGYLYLGTGDATVPATAQDTNSLAGKILRMDRNGLPAPGNPFHNYVWTYGHRNVQGFDWNDQGKMIATEHGPTGEFGWFSHDEINLIVPGKNYGWPIALGGTETDSLTPPILCSGSSVTWAPSGCTFIHGTEWGSWNGNFIFGALKSQRLIHLDMNATGDGILAEHDTLINTYLRLRNVIQAPDGSILFCSSNSGYTTPILPGDDKIYRLYWTE
ncbi:MAG: PQQ-dependent sugar dehydrogenase [Bacteroidia bacterium]